MQLLRTLPQIFTTYVQNIACPFCSAHCWQWVSLGRCLNVLLLVSYLQLLNFSIRLGKLPDAWKTSFVVPIPKSSKNHLPSNYRSISLLCILSKVLEKHIFLLIVEHLEDHYPCHSLSMGIPARKVHSICTTVNYS